MTDIAGSYSKIQQEEVQTKSAASEFTMTKIGAAINAIIEGGAHPIGTVLSSILTEAQFQGIMGTNWVRIDEDGTSLSGTDLFTLTGISSIGSLPAGYGFINAANTSLAGISTGDNKAHTHTVTVATEALNPSGTPELLVSKNDNPLSANTNLVYTSSSSGGSANLAAGIKVNFFIKVNV